MALILPTKLKQKREIVAGNVGINKINVIDYETICSFGTECIVESDSWFSCITTNRIGFDKAERKTGHIIVE